MWPSKTSAAQAVGWAARLAVGWGVLGVLGLLGEALLRLAPHAFAPLQTGMAPLAWAVYIGFVSFNAYAEGYRGFQRAFSPRVAVRAQWLARHTNWSRFVLAPLFLMGLVEATRRRLLINWSLVLVISGLVIAVRALPQPWRGVVDAGVLAGLSWGLVSTLLALRAALRGHTFAIDPELPERAGSPDALAPSPTPTRSTTT